tara:strand:- start:13891 stop:14616 length:726 start_codon:yes stop_codon:yes gene_type:complete
MSIYPKIKDFGEQALLLEWNNEISLTIHKEIMRYKHTIDSRFQSIVIETVPTYASLAIYLNKSANKEAFISELNSGLLLSEIIQKSQRIIHIPVCYEIEYGWDLPEMAHKLNIPIDEIISRHIDQEYPVYFLGFLPGFPYLGGLDPKIAFQRKATPRKQVDKGSVGIAGSQTGIYTMDSPGGWNIIGRSPLNFFDVSQENPCLLVPGDLVKFYKISRKLYEEIYFQVKNQNYSLRKEVRDV